MKSIHTICIYSGGILVIFSGTKLDVVQRPVMVINDTGYLDTVTVSEKHSDNYVHVHNISLASVYKLNYS